MNSSEKLPRYSRIRGTEQKDGTYKTNVFISATTGALYEVIYDYRDMSYIIRNVRRERPVYRSKDIQKKEIKNPRTLRYKIKKLLSDLGVNFRLEIKPRGIGFKKNNTEWKKVHKKMGYGEFSKDDE